MKKAALFCMSSLGLGHAARTLPIIKSYMDTHEAHIMCTGSALKFLRAEFAGTDAVFYDCPDYPPLERGKGWKFYWYLVVDSISTIFIIRRETAFVKNICDTIHPEFIITDGRYGSHVKGIPSAIISHQISFVMPRGFGMFQKIADNFNYKTFVKFDHLIIPDYESETENLAGVLSHHPMLSKLNHTFVGVLSSHIRSDGPKDIDFLFMVSGYLVEHKAQFIESLMQKAEGLSGKKVFILGNTAEDFHQIIPEKNIEIYSSVAGKLRAEIFGRAKFIISRSGYTTIMDLVELGIVGTLVPTPGQTEQEYLAKYMEEKNYMKIPFKAPWRTDISVKKIHEIMYNLGNVKSL